MYQHVELGGWVGVTDLERILVQAGKERGLRTVTEDLFRAEYTISGNKVSLRGRYTGTRISLLGRVLPFLTVSITGLNRDKKEDTKTNLFGLGTGLFDGFASRRQIEEYLSVVSQRLQEENMAYDNVLRMF